MSTDHRRDGEAGANVLAVCNRHPPHLFALLEVANGNDQRRSGQHQVSLGTFCCFLRKSRVSSVVAVSFYEVKLGGSTCCVWQVSLFLRTPLSRLTLLPRCDNFNVLLCLFFWKILAPADAERDDGRTKSKQGWLPLALEGPGATGAALTTIPTATTAPNTQEPTPTAIPPSALPSEDDGRSSSVVRYRLLDPDAAVEELRLRWAELVEPPQGDYVEPRDDDGGTPWARR